MWRSAMNAIFLFRKKPTLHRLSQTCASTSKHVIFLQLLEADVHVLTRGRCCVATPARDPPFQSISVPGALAASGAAPRKGLDDYYPATGLLRCFAHAEVPITFGSDAHRACDICWNIREAQAHAYNCGYRTFGIPHLTGEWELTPLA